MYQSNFKKKDMYQSSLNTKALEQFNPTQKRTKALKHRNKSNSIRHEKLTTALTKPFDKDSARGSTGSHERA